MPLPDLDTSNIAVLGAWNHLDNGADTIDPSETTSVMSSYTEYSNGVDGTYSLPLDNGTREAKVRVKDDGWLIAWITQDYEDYTRRVNSSRRGPWDLFNDHTSSGSSMNVDKTWLAYAIQDMRSALSNSGASTFNATDVAHSWYWDNEESATNLTMWGWGAVGAGGSETDITWPSDGSVSTVYRYDTAASTTYYNGETSARVNDPAGNKYIIGTTDPNDDPFGSADLLANGWASEGATTTFRTGGNGGESFVVLIVWD